MRKCSFKLGAAAVAALAIVSSPLAQRATIYDTASVEIVDRSPALSLPLSAPPNKYSFDLRTPYCGLGSIDGLLQWHTWRVDQIGNEISLLVPSRQWSLKYSAFR